MKLKAYSILELLVAILISGIVISAAYSVFIFSNKQFFRFTAVKTDVRDYFELSSTIKRDFENAKTVVKVNEGEIEMELTNQQINYQFETNYILRNIDFHTDTFLFSVTNMEINTLNNYEQGNFINYLKLDLKNNSLSFFKDYGAIAKLEE